MPNKEIIFAKGLFFDQPSPKAPSFVKGSVSINVREFINFLNEHENEEGYVNLNLKEAKAGNKFYFDLNTYRKEDPVKKKEEEGLAAHDAAKKAPEKQVEYPADDINPEDIPF